VTDWRAKLRNPFVQQYLVEILFPLVGYFFFDWSLTVIAVFYLIDQLASETAFIRRLYKISSSSEIRSTKIIFSAIILFVLIFLVELFFLHNSFQHIRSMTSEQLNSEIIVFAKEELWILFPLVILLYHFKDQFTFYIPRRYLQYNIRKTFTYHQIGSLIMLIIILAGFMLWQISGIHDMIILISFLVLKIVFDFSIGKWIDRKSKK